MSIAVVKCLECASAFLRQNGRGFFVVRAVWAEIGTFAPSTFNATHTDMRKFASFALLLALVALAASCRASRHASASVSEIRTAEASAESLDSVASFRSERDSLALAAREERKSAASQSETGSFEELVTERVVEEYDTAGRKVTATFRSVVRRGSLERQSAWADTLARSGSLWRASLATADSSASRHERQEARSEQRADSVSQSSERNGGASASPWRRGFTWGAAALALLAAFAAVWVKWKTK